MHTRAILVACAVLMVAGLALMGAQLGVVATAIGAMVFGLAFVGLLSGAFYAVGRSEDRERRGR